MLELRAAHAAAREAVHKAVDFELIGQQLYKLGPIGVDSQAKDRATYLRRPDLGRRLEPSSRYMLEQRAGPYDFALVIADGLSASAVMTQACAVVLALREELPELRWAPLVLARQGRVALGDEIGQALGAEIIAVLVGERPGLSVSDSLGIYVTFDPRVGRNDSERNCISNVHTGGASAADAAAQLAALVREARRLRLTGVGLKLPSTRAEHLSVGRAPELLEPKGS